MQPIRRLQNATHFKYVTSQDKTNPAVMKKYLTPCSPGDPDAIEKTWTEVESDELLDPELTSQDFMRTISTARPSVNQADLNQHVKFTNEFGQEG
jgi:vacuolar protein-sorting-associated protein 4